MAMTAAEVKTQFTAELKALLDKWNAELEAEDHWTGYAECGQDVRMTVTIPSIYNEEIGERVRELTEIDLGRWLSGK